MLLELKSVEVRYGGIRAVKGIDLAVAEGELVTLIGANGAGKSSTLKAICGLAPVHTGSVRYADAEISRAKVHELPRRGLVLVPEGRGIFPQLTVQENLAMGAYAHGGGDPEPQYASFPRLKERRHQVAGTLSGGEQQMLAIARALMSRPKLLLCDEPSLGLAPLITKELFNIIGGLNERWGIAVLLVEQNANLAMHIAGRVYLLETGTIVGTGSADEIAADDSIRKAYLGY